MQSNCTKKGLYFVPISCSPVARPCEIMLKISPIILFLDSRTLNLLFFYFYPIIILLLSYYSHIILVSFVPSPKVVESEEEAGEMKQLNLKHPNSTQG